MMVIGWNGTFEIYSKSVNDDKFILVDTIKNTITDLGLNMLRESLRTSTNNAEIKYIAVGNSTASVSTSDTTLGNETFRKPVFSKSATTTGSVQTIGILDDSEAVGQIYEIGIFAGSTASTTKDSGIMLSRILYSRNKTNLESLQIQRTDTIGRV